MRGDRGDRRECERGQGGSVGGDRGTREGESVRDVKKGY